MVQPARIDPKIPTRAVDFAEALQVLALAHEEPRTYTQLLNLAKGNKIVVDRTGKRGLAKSSFHRNWKTLEVLGLIVKDGSFHKPTKRGEELLTVFAQEDNVLGSGTKYLLRQAMLASDVARANFFALFATERTRQPLEHTAALALIPIEGDSAGSKERAYRLRNIATGFTYDLRWRQVNGIIWGLGSWAVKIGLADQLYARPQDGIPNELSKIVFIVNPDRVASEISDEFNEEIEKWINLTPPIYGETVRLPISWLLYQVCPGVQINTVTAREELINWLEANDRRAFVEGASLPVVKSGRQKTRAGSRIKWANQEPALLEMDGRYYSYLFAQRRKR
jgi:hypothetical protein